MLSETVFILLIFIELGASALIFLFLFFIKAPYGRHYRKGWGFVLYERIAWVMMEFPAFFMPLLFFIIGKQFLTIPSIIFLLLWELHYIQRTFIYSALIPRQSRNFPLIVAFMAFAFNLMNGYIQGFYLFMKPGIYPLSWLLDIRFLSGLVIFLCGYMINLAADKRLRDLKQNSKGTYAIPSGGMFTLISCPNYFGEIIEWTGWAILTWSLPGLVFALFTLANLLPRALSHHKWYKETFPGYPQTRKAIIPFLV